MLEGLSYALAGACIALPLPECSDVSVPVSPCSAGPLYGRFDADAEEVADNRGRQFGCECDECCVACLPYMEAMNSHSACKSVVGDVAGGAAAGKEPRRPFGSRGNEWTALRGGFGWEPAEDACQRRRNQDDWAANGNRESIPDGGRAGGAPNKVVAGQLHDPCDLDAIEEDQGSCGVDVVGDGFIPQASR